MRLGQFSDVDGGEPWAGVVRDDGTVIELRVAGEAAGVDLPRTTTGILRQWEWRRKVDLAVEHAEATGAGDRDAAALDRHAPVTDPQKVVCVGLNYRDHAEEGDNPIPDEPVLFAKFPIAITDPGSTIEWDPAFTEQVDYEAELVAVVGREARDVDREEAGEYVAGYTVGNDVSARDVQHGDGQWVRGKSLDTFAPVGPEIVTADELGDPEGRAIWTEVNGQRLQDSSTDNLIFGIGDLVAVCSQAFTLTPGDLIFTGTPPGVGVYREPPVLLEEGDTVTVAVEGIGELTNDCGYR